MTLRHGLHVAQPLLGQISACANATAALERPEPGGPVILTARKADEQVTISLPLGEDVVRSNWEGFAGEACVDSFMEYVAAMDERGVTVTPGDKMADRPSLRAAGYKDLPRGETRGK